MALPKNWRRSLIRLGVMFVALSTLDYFLRQAMYLHEARKFSRNNPILWKIPVELSDTSVAKSVGSKLTYFGYEFEVPWADLDQQKIRATGDGDYILIPFHTGRTIVLSEFPPDYAVGRFLKGENQVELRNLRWVYGNEALQSDFAFEHATLYTTPTDIRLLSSHRDALRAFTLLLRKGVYLDSGVFSTETAKFRGFQFGNPQSDRRVVDDLYSDNGQLKFVFSHCRNSPTILQSEINLVIQSVRPVTQSTPAAIHK